MEQDKINQAAPINTGFIIAGMLLMFILVHVGFQATYFKHFPEFKKFTWIHHVHGALMGSWVLMLVLQPILIYKQKFAAHRFIGKLSYVIAPLMVATMLLVARINYHTGIAQTSSEEIFSRQSNTWMQIFMFVLFYALAISYRKHTDRHMRFMIATAIVMSGPAMSRIIFNYWGEASVPYNVIIPFCVKTGLAALLLIADITRKKNWMPYFIVLLAFLLADLVYYARYSDAWQAFGKFVIHNLYR